MENKWKEKNLLIALKHSFNGIKCVFKSERNIKIQLIFAILVIIFGIILKINFIQFAILILTIFMVLICEFINTAIETIVDMYTLEYNEKAKIAKDISAGAVTLSAFCSVIIGIIIFIPNILK